MSTISFVYFDVGGVAIKDFSDSNKWGVMMRDMGFQSKDMVEVDQIYDAFEDDVCKGRRSIDELVPLYKEKFTLPISSNFSILHYFVDHFDPNPSLWPIVHDLKAKGIKIGLLTDQYPGMLEGIKVRSILPPVEWDTVVDSSVVGVRKPEEEIYRIATDKAGVPISEILFVDNRQKNLDGAARIGWHTFLYDSKEYEKSSGELAQYLSNLV